MWAGQQALLKVDLPASQTPQTFDYFWVRDTTRLPRTNQLNNPEDLLSRWKANKFTLKNCLSSVVSLMVMLPSWFKVRVARHAFSFYQRIRQSRRPRFGGFSDSSKPGVNLAAYIRGEMGLGQAGRGIAEALEAAQISFNIIDFEIDNFAGQADTSWLHKVTANSDYDVTIVVINPDNLGNAQLCLPKNVFSKPYVIAYWFWEMPEIPDNWQAAFSMVDEVWAPSRFIEEALKAKSPVPVTRIPPVVKLRNKGTLSRQCLTLPEEQFLFLCMADASSVMERKNPPGVIAAFQKAFGRNDSSVGLIVKVRERHPFRRDVSALRNMIKGWANIHLLEQNMNHNEISSLLSITDCFVSLHRAEGFGFVPAEAMSLGKPVMITRWSGNTDYMTPDNSIGIDYELTTLRRNYGPYKTGQVWAEPDINQAASWMKKLAGDRDFARMIGARGQQTIQQDFSPAVVGNLIRKRLSEIREQNRCSKPLTHDGVSGENGRKGKLTVEHNYPVEQAVDILENQR